MSFVYACKDIITNSLLGTLTVYSDTKITLTSMAEKLLDYTSLKSIKQFGIIKTIIIDDHCCFSFAGNNIELVYDLLTKFNSVNVFEFLQKN